MSEQTGVAARARQAIDPALDYMRDETAGGVALLVATFAALAWANLAPGGYEGVWTAKLDAGLLDLDLRHWVNDGLMAVFFFLVGMEIKRELVTGDLRGARAAALPAVAAAGGVVLPILIFLAIAGGGEGAAGWAIPAATDIAFAVGLLALLGDRVSSGARLLLLSIAIVDDVIAIAIIAVAYSGGLSAAWLAAAAAVLLAVAGARATGVHRIAFYVPLGAVAWFAVHESGVHATIAGVALGLLTPARPVAGRDVIAAIEHRLHPVTAFGVVPLFALANAGVELGGGVLGDAFSSSLTWGIIAGLVVGKLAGITGATLAAGRFGLRRPAGVSGQEVAGVAAVAGIGFTVALFIASLAFDDAELVEQAKIGIFAGSLVSALLGAAILLLRTGGRREATGNR